MAEPKSFLYRGRPSDAKHVLVDHARKRCAGKRAGVPIDPLLEYALAFNDSQSEMIVSVNEALNRLESLDQRQARIVEIRFSAA